MFHGEIAGVMLLLGRILYGGLLTFMATSHFMRTKELAQYAAMKKTPMPTLAILGSGAFLLADALSILNGAWCVARTGTSTPYWRYWVAFARS